MSRARAKKKRGAPKGNQNARKHGFYDLERREMSPKYQTSTPAELVQIDEWHFVTQNVVPLRDCHAPLDPLDSKHLTGLAMT